MMHRLLTLGPDAGPAWGADGAAPDPASGVTRESPRPGNAAPEEDEP